MLVWGTLNSSLSSASLCYWRFSLLISFFFSHPFSHWPTPQILYLSLALTIPLFYSSFSLIIPPLSSLSVCFTLLSRALLECNSCRSRNCKELTSSSANPSHTFSLSLSLSLSRTHTMHLLASSQCYCLHRDIRTMELLTCVHHTHTLCTHIHPHSPTLLWYTHKHITFTFSRRFYPKRLTMYTHFTFYTDGTLHIRSN